MPQNIVLPRFLVSDLEEEEEEEEAAAAAESIIASLLLLLSFSPSPVGRSVPYANHFLHFAPRAIDLVTFDS